MFPKNKSCWG